MVDDVGERETTRRLTMQQIGEERADARREALRHEHRLAHAYLVDDAPRFDVMIGIAPDEHRVEDDAETPHVRFQARVATALDAEHLGAAVGGRTLPLVQPIVSVVRYYKRIVEALQRQLGPAVQSPN